MSGELHCDVLVLGGGNAALTAAITAREMGAGVVLLEAAPRHMRGGNSRHTRNCRCMHDAPLGVLSDRYPEQEYFDDLMRVTGGLTNEALARLVIRESARLPVWMTAHGCVFQPSLTGTLHLGRTNAFFLGGGKALVNAYFAVAERIGVRVFYDAQVTAVHLDGDRFRSVAATIDGQAVTLKARALVAASGGFEANLDWLEQAWGPSARNFLIRGTPYNTGVVLRSMLDQGVEAVGDPTQCHAVAIDARAPKFDGGIATRLDSVTLGIVVNRDGQRFYDEGEDFWPKRYAIWGRLVAQQPDQIAYSIVDASAIGRFMPSVFPPVQAESIAQLGAKLGLPVPELERTVAQFNAAVQPGSFDHALLDGCRTVGLAPDKTHWARRIETPPYSGYPLRPGITFTYLGVKVDDRARVWMRDGRPLRNVFAAGEIMAGNVLGKGYLAGIGMTIGGVFGRIAGAQAGARATERAAA